MAWPQDAWKANQDGRVYQTAKGATRQIFVQDCGGLTVPTGRLTVSDPFCFLSPVGNLHVQLRPGTYPVNVTLVDASESLDRTSVRVAYASLILSAHAEVERRLIERTVEGGEVMDIGPDGEFTGFPVDAGTASFVDEGALRNGMPPVETWGDGIFENDDPSCRFNRMDDPDHIRAGLANIPLTLATDGANIVLFESGRGDGVCPPIGGYDAEGDLVAVHTDYLVA